MPQHGDSDTRIQRVFSGCILHSWLNGLFPARLAQVLYTAHAFHGSFLLDAPLRASLMAEVTQLLSDTGRSMAALAAPLLQPTLRRLTTFMEGR
jgi:hypothetical protein